METRLQLDDFDGYAFLPIRPPDRQRSFEINGTAVKKYTVAHHS